jgi:hypothetical protein
MDALKALARLGALDRIQVMWSPPFKARLIISIPVGPPHIDVMLLDRSGKKRTLRDSDRNFREAWSRLNEDWELDSAMSRAKKHPLMRQEVAMRGLGGCEHCKQGTFSGSPPEQIAINLETHAQLRRCRACGSLWIENEREAHVITGAESRETFPTAFA